MHARIAAHGTWLAVVAGLGLAAPATAQLDESLFHDPASPVDDTPGALAAADLDGDARMDLVVSCGGSHTIRVLLGAGDGSFPKGKSFDVPSAGPFGTAAAMGDFNEDGELDLATGSGSNLISLLLGLGDGDFVSGSPIVLQAQPWALAQADFDSDGHADLVVTHSYSSFAPGTVEVLLGNGDGTFVSRSTTAVGYGPLPLIVDDFNADGRQDVAVETNMDTALWILLGMGDGTFASPSSIDLGSGGGGSSFWLVSGDFNEDGLPDLGACCFQIGASFVLSILLGAGDGSFVNHASYAAFGPYVADDFNGDGHLDLACSSDSTGKGTILLGEGDGDFVVGSHFATGLVGGHQIAALLSGDFDGDGRLDLALSNWIQDRVAVRFGAGDGSFPATTNSWKYTQPTQAVVTGDLDGDGLQDAVTASSQFKWLTTLLGQGDGTLQKFGTFALGQQPMDVALGDLDGDGQLDAVTANHFNDQAMVLLGTGTGALALAESYPVGDQPMSVAIGDFNEDGLPDVVTANHASDSVSILLGHGQGGLSSAGSAPAGDEPVFVVTGLLNDDGTLDLAVANKGGAVTILAGSGTGGFAPAQSVPVAAAAHSLAVADVDGDGWQDLLVGHDAGTSVTLLHGTSAGFVAADSLTAGPRPLAVAAADLDGDGTVDVAAANASCGTVSVLRGAGDGGFALDGHFVCTEDIDEPRALAIVDLNDDGHPDMVTVGADPYPANLSGTWGVLLNKGPSPWKDLGLALAGSLQEPQLTGSGPLESSSENSVQLTYAKPGMTAVLVAGFDAVGLPLKGGTLVPMPQFLVLFHVPTTGALELPFHMPPGVPAALALYSQTWILDDQGPAGWAATNGLLGVTP